MNNNDGKYKSYGRCSEGSSYGDDHDDNDDDATAVAIPIVQAKFRVVRSGAPTIRLRCRGAIQMGNTVTSTIGKLLMSRRTLRTSFENNILLLI